MSKATDHVFIRDIVRGVWLLSVITESNVLHCRIGEQSISGTLPRPSSTTHLPITDGDSQQTGIREGEVWTSYAETTNSNTDDQSSTKKETLLVFC